MTSGFALWALLMAGVVVAMALISRRSKRVDAKAEETASEALPDIGGIAERMHVAHFGRAPTTPPVSGTWYPPPKTPGKQA
jgi:hypothetical protein